MWLLPALFPRLPKVQANGSRRTSYLTCQRISLFDRKRFCRFEDLHCEVVGELVHIQVFRFLNLHMFRGFLLFSLLSSDFCPLVAHCAMAATFRDTATSAPAI